MNCKPGDLAFLVRSLAGNHGSVVRCVEYAGEIKFMLIGPRPAWFIEPAIQGLRGPTNYAPDEWLRPIRPDSVTDEEVKELFAPSLPVKEQA